MVRVVGRIIIINEEINQSLMFGWGVIPINVLMVVETMAWWGALSKSINK